MVLEHKSEPCRTPAGRVKLPYQLSRNTAVRPDGGGVGAAQMLFPPNDARPIDTLLGRCPTKDAL